MFDGGEASGFASSEQVTNYTRKCSVHNTTIEVLGSTGETNTRCPELTKYVNKRYKVMIETCQRRLIRARNNAKKKHILGLIAHFNREIKAYQGDEPNRPLLSCLFISQRIEKINTKGKKISALLSRQAKVLSIWALEVSNDFALEDVFQFSTRRLIIAFLPSFVHHRLIPRTRQQSCQPILEAERYEVFDRDVYGGSIYMT
jgi:hypothetical protein